MNPSKSVSNSELAVLGLLFEQPKHGYQVELDIHSRGMREWTDIGFSSIYQMLNKMESAGWLKSSREESVDRPTRKVYRLSSNGFEVYTAAVRDRLRAPRPNTGDFSLALANLGCLSEIEIISTLKENRAALQVRLVQIQNKHTLDQETKRLPWFVNALFDYSEKLILTEAEFIDQLLQKISSSKQSGE